MDPVINSLVQSPLVRSMSTVPSKASSFVHGVKDNVPPFSFQKVVVKPWNNPSTTTQDHSHKFRIPQYGTLNRAYLRIKTINQIPTSAGIIETDYPAGTLFDATSNDPVTDNTKYDTLRGKFRIPWIHNNQPTQQAKKSSPFGGGGASQVIAGALVAHNASTADPGTTNYSSGFRRMLMEPDSLQGTASSAWNVINVLDEMRLTTNGKLIETVYGETIPAEVVKMPEGLRDFYIRGMVGWAMGDNAAAPLSEPNYEYPWDPSACHRDNYGRYTIKQKFINATTQVAGYHNQHANFIVPVTLSSLKSLPKNYQTRFVEDLELEVKMKSLGRGFNEFTAGSNLTSHHEVELVLIYHNWHDNIENTIRNSNYKRGVPASVFSSNWVRAATTTPVPTGHNALSIPLTSRNLVTEMVIVAKSLSAGNHQFLEALRRRKSDYTIYMNREFKYDVELQGSGKTIWSATNLELQGPDSSDYDLVERSMRGGDCGFGGKSHKASTATHWTDFPLQQALLVQGGGVTNLLNAGDVTQGGVDFSFGDNMACMRFGFNTQDEYYSGGIALQTISNPTLKITPAATDQGEWHEHEIVFDVYVKHANLVRIDSDTGAVTRTLDV